MSKRIVSQKGKTRKRKITGTPMHTEQGKVIGDVIGDVFGKDIDNGCILKKFNALASDICTLHEAENAGALFVEFTNMDDGIVYRAPIVKFWNCGFFVDFGFGKQQALNLSHFEHRRTITTHTAKPEYTAVTDTEDVKPLEYSSYAPVGVKFTPGVKQLDLFGGR